MGKPDRRDPVSLKDKRNMAKTASPQATRTLESGVPNHKAYAMSGELPGAGADFGCSSLATTQGRSAAADSGSRPVRGSDSAGRAGSLVFALGCFVRTGGRRFHGDFRDTRAFKMNVAPDESRRRHVGDTARATPPPARNGNTRSQADADHGDSS